MAKFTKLSFVNNEFLAPNVFMQLFNVSIEYLVGKVSDCFIDSCCTICLACICTIYA